MTAPFPWHALPRVSSVQTHAAARVRRAWAGVSMSAIASSLRELVHHPITLEVRRVNAITSHKLDLGARGTVIVLGDDTRVVAVEIEAELALAIASTLAGGKLPRTAKARKVDPEVAGAIAGVAQWLARSCLGGPLSILAIEPERLVDHLGVDALAIDVSVGLGVLRTIARVAVSVPELDATPGAGAIDAKTTLRRLGDTPLSLHVVCACGLARAADLTRVGRGDVVVVAKTELVLVAADASEGLRVRAADADGTRRVVLEEGRVELASPLAAETGLADESRPMTDEDARDATMQLPALEDGARLAEDLAELPLQVRVEMGTATLAAREWATLGTGDTLILDRRVGDAVTLRIGGRALARGELVDVDGAIGVRITERLS